MIPDLALAYFSLLSMRGRSRLCALEELSVWSRGAGCVEEASWEGPPCYSPQKVIQNTEYRIQFSCEQCKKWQLKITIYTIIYKYIIVYIVKFFHPFFSTQCYSSWENCILYSVSIFHTDNVDLSVWISGLFSLSGFTFFPVRWCQGYAAGRVISR